jgi:high affinity Mn2+ porin
MLDFGKPATSGWGKLASIRIHDASAGMPPMLRLKYCAWLACAASGLLAPPGRAGDSGETVTLSENWSVHGQGTLVYQGYPSYHAAFSGPNSLAPNSQAKETSDLTLYLGVRLFDNLAFYVNPEADQGFGLSDTLGMAGFASGEAYKVGEYNPYYRTPRAFFRYVQNLGGELETDEPDANQLGGSHSHDNLTFTFGKFGVPDIFDTNKYAHDPRGDFLNWTIVEAGAFDYPADAWGFAYGGAAEWTQSWWTLRAGLFDLSRYPNATAMTRGLGQFSIITEGEERHELWHQPGTVKLTFFVNRGRMGSYGAADALGEETDSAPNTALVRQFTSRAGGALNVQQQIQGDLGAFLRVSFNNGNEETFEFTDANRSVSGGLSLQGSKWGRPNDTVGLAGVINGISPAAQRYFAAGGLGVLVGDGALPRYGVEKIVETYYSAQLAHWAVLSLDYQFVNNPAYNPERGPISIFALRVHLEF